MSINIIEQRLKRQSSCLTIVAHERRNYHEDSADRSRNFLSPVYGRGLMWTDAGVISLDHKTPLNFDYDSVQDRSGQWFMVFHNEFEDSYRVVTDFMGYYRLYYTTFRRGKDQVLIIGDNQTSIAAELRRLGRPVSVYWPVAASHLLSTHTILQSSYSHKTMFNGVRSLPADAALIVDHTGIREERKDRFAADSDASYEDLLAAGIERAQHQLRLMAAAPIRDKRHALSGGRDSRIAMAIAVSAGVHHEFSIMTGDPRTARGAQSRKVLERDLQVAVGLRRFLQLDWARETQITGVRNDAHTSLDIFQSRFAGARFSWPAGSTVTWPQELRLEVHGGSGELIRRAYQNMRNHPSFSSLADRPDTVVEDARKLFPTVVRHHQYLPADLQAEATDVFAESMRIGENLSLSEQLNLHYASFRNRDHFGEMIHRYDRNALTLYPLAQPEFLQASRLLDPEERTQGRVAYDIIQMTYSDLNEFAFDDGYWPEKFMPIRNRRYYDQDASDFNDTQNFYHKEDSDYRLRSSVQLLNDPNNPVKAFDSTSTTTSMSANAVWELLEHTSPPVSGLGSIIPTLVAQGTLAPGPTAAKLETISSVFTGRHAEYDPVLFSSRQVGENVAISADEQWHAASNQSIRIRRVDPFIFHVDLKIEDGRAIVRARCNSDEVEGREWAVYLYRERNKIAERWYSTESTAEFLLSDVDPAARLRALVFSRRADTEQRVLKKYSNWIQPQVS